MRPASFVLASLLGLALAASSAQAQLARSFVSADIGNDGNAPNCNRTTPCRTFQVAHDNTLALGEITVLTSGSYGAVAINRNISIINDGVGEAGILVSGGGVAITVNAPGASVTLRGLTIKGIGFGGGNGIQFSAGNALNVENCTIRNLDGTNLGRGISYLPSGTAALQVTNSIVSDNAGDGIVIGAVGDNANVVAALDHVGIYNNGGSGLLVSAVFANTGVVQATAVESQASNNNNNNTSGSAGFLAAASGKGFANILLVRSVASGNLVNGVLSTGVNAQIIVNTSAVYGNVSGWAAINGGQLFSFGNNAVIFNDSNGSGQSPLSLK